jgi:hypothetical protein
MTTFKNKREVYQALSNNKFNVLCLFVSLMNIVIFFTDYDVDNLTIAVLFVSCVIRDWNSATEFEVE